MNNASHIQICPFLGLRDDATSSLAFPSDSNYCYRSQPIAVVCFTHQEEACLGGKYHECPVFLREQAGSLPSHLRAHQKRKSAGKSKNSNTRQRNIIAALAAIIVVFIIFAWEIYNHKSNLTKVSAPTISITAPSSATNTNTPEPTITPSPLPPTETPTPTLHIPFFGSITVTPSLTSSPTTTPTKVERKHALDVAVGTDHKFIIHRIEAGDFLDPYAEKYNTSVDAIKSINYYLYLDNPVRNDTLVIFPIGIVDVSGLYVLGIYKIEEADRGSSFEYLARKLKFDLNDFKYYNGIVSYERPLVGEYYLIPQKRLIP
jgi:hypothetical protein